MITKIKANNDLINHVLKSSTPVDERVDVFSRFEMDADDIKVIFDTLENPANEYTEEFKATTYRLVSKYQVLSTSDIDRYKDKLDWQCICKYQKLDSYLMRNFKNFLDLNLVARFQVLDPEIIREMKDELDFDIVCKYQILGEDLMEELIDYIDYETVSTYQILSVGFIEKYLDRLHVPSLAVSGQLTVALLDAHAEELEDSLNTMAFYHIAKKVADLDTSTTFKTMYSAQLAPFKS
jgi:hypothetical protein